MCKMSDCFLNCCFEDNKGTVILNIEANKDKKS